MNKNRIISSAEAINEALRQIGEVDKDVLLMAEGIDDPSSIFGTTKNLSNIYGKHRIIEMPTSENGICGIAIGAAMSGKKPIVSFHRVEFALLAMEQIINNAAKMHYLSNGKHQCPLIIRLVVGRGWGQGPEHSQSLETLFSYIPGLKVLMPTFPEDYKGMMVSAVKDNNPIIIIEHRWTHYIKGSVSADIYNSDITKPKKIKNGDQVTIISTSLSTIEALKASEFLENYGITCDLFDLRVARPLALNDIFSSVKKTSCFLTVDIGYKLLGLGSEITSQIVENCFSSLKKAPKRIGLPDHPTPSSRGYIKGFYPDYKKIILNVCDLVDIDQKIKDKILTEVINKPDELPIDIPDPSFQGPF